MANIKVCTKCGKIGLDQIDFRIQYDKRDNKYYYHPECLECGRKQSNQYNKNHSKQIKQYYQNNKEYYKEYTKRWGECNSEYVKKRDKQYREDNKERRKIYNKQYYQDNKNFRKKYSKQWKQDNPNKLKAYDRKRRALKAGAEGSHSVGDLKYIYDHQQGKCPCCKKYIPFEKMTVDHIVPLTWGGSNYASNIQLLCLSCNSSKGAHHATDYRDYIPLFLN